MNSSAVEAKKNLLLVFFTYFNLFMIVPSKTNNQFIKVVINHATQCIQYSLKPNKELVKLQIEMTDIMYPIC